MKNLKEFKELIELYESTTLSDIEECWDEETAVDEILCKLTGFGNNSTCTLCIAIGQDKARLGQRECRNCVYGEYYKDDDEDFMYYPCCRDITYDNIEESETPEELLERIKQRADFMKSILKSLQK